jgi:hypothetical protein
MEVVGTIITLAVVFIAIVSRVISWLGEIQRNNAQRERAAKAQPVKRESLDDEIGQFLQRSAERRAAERARPQDASGPAPQAPPPQRPSQPPPLPSQRRPAAPPLPSREAAVSAQIVEEPKTGDLSRRHLQTAEFAKIGSQLGAEVAQSDEKLESRLHQTFDHRLGRLARSEQPAVVPAAASATTPTAALVAMLGNPATVQQAVLLSEILNRPVSRWE